MNLSTGLKKVVSLGTSLTPTPVKIAAFAIASLAMIERSDAQYPRPHERIVDALKDELVLANPASALDRKALGDIIKKRLSQAEGGDVEVIKGGIYWAIKEKYTGDDADLTDDQKAKIEEIVVKAFDRKDEKVEAKAKSLPVADANRLRQLEKEATERAKKEAEQAKRDAERAEAARGGGGAPKVRRAEGVERPRSSSRRSSSRRGSSGTESVSPQIANLREEAEAARLRAEIARYEESAHRSISKSDAGNAFERGRAKGTERGSGKFFEKLWTIPTRAAERYIDGKVRQKLKRIK